MAHSSTSKRQTGKTKSSHIDMNLDSEECSSNQILNHKEPSQIVTEEQINDLRDNSIEQIQVKMAGIYSLMEFDVNLKEGAILDSYVSAYWFAVEEHFDMSTICFFMNLLYELMESCKNGTSFRDNVELMKSYFHPVKVAEISNINSKRIISYIMESLFQHYALYVYLFTRQQEQIIIKQQLTVDSIPRMANEQPPPLEEGLPEHLYLKYIAPPKPEHASNAGPTPKVEATPTVELGENTLCGDCIDGSKEQTPKEDKEQDNHLVSLLKSMTAEEIKSTVEALAQEKLKPLKVEMETKMQEREAVLLSKIKKMHTS